MLYEYHHQYKYKNPREVRNLFEKKRCWSFSENPSAESATVTQRLNILNLILNAHPGITLRARRCVQFHGHNYQSDLKKFEKEEMQKHSQGNFSVVLPDAGYSDPFLKENFKRELHGHTQITTRFPSKIPAAKSGQLQ